MQNVKKKRFGGDWAELRPKLFICSDNPGQSIWNKSKIEKSRKTGQGNKSLMSTFACFFHCYCQSLISGRDTGRWAMPPPKFEIFLSRLATREATHIPSLQY